MGKISHENFAARVKELHPNIELIGEYRSSGKRIEVRCKKCGHQWKPIAGSLLRGHGCPACAGAGQISQTDFEKKLKSKRDDVILVGPYEKSLKKTEFKFLNCGHTCSMTPSKVLSMRGCPICAKARKGASQRYTLEEVKQIVHDLNPKLDVATGEAYFNSHTRMRLHCKDCGREFFQSLNKLRRSSQCPLCHCHQTSFFEMFIFHAFVLALGEDKVFTRDKEAIGKELDVYIPSLKFAIEPGSWSLHQRRVANDKQKHDLCVEKGILLVTVYDHYDGQDAPFEHCLTLKGAITDNKTSLARLEKLVRVLFQVAGVSHTFSSSGWAKIAKRARKDCRRMSTKEFNEELALINPDIEFLDTYDLANSLKWFRCKKCGHTWKASPTTIRMGHGCPKCAGVLRLTHDTFMERVHRYYPNIQALEPFRNLKTAMRFHCNLCNQEFTKKPYRLIYKNSTGCSYCQNRQLQDKNR